MSALKTIFSKLYTGKRESLSKNKKTNVKPFNLSMMEEISTKMDSLYEKSNSLYGKCGELATVSEKLSSEAAEFAQEKQQIIEAIDEIKNELDDLGLEYPPKLEQAISNLGYFKDNAEELKDMLDQAKTNMNVAMSNIEG